MRARHSAVAEEPRSRNQPVALSADAPQNVTDKFASASLRLVPELVEVQGPEHHRDATHQERGAPTTKDLPSQPSPNANQHPHPEPKFTDPTTPVTTAPTDDELTNSAQTHLQVPQSGTRRE